jgi:hypothetical protein
MKVIQVGGILPPDTDSPYARHRFYRFTLGNGRILLFSSARDAKAYQAETERWLTGQLHTLNALYAQAHADYRNAWPALATQGAPAMGNAEGRMRMALQGAEDALERAARGGHGPNRMHFAWRALEAGATHARTVHLVLADWYRYKTQGVWRYHAVMRSQQCDRMLEELASYGLGAGAAGDELHHNGSGTAR